MRQKPKERPNSAQPPRNQLGSPGAQPVPSLNLPNRAMSVSVKPQSSSKEGASRYVSFSQQSQSLSKAYSNSGQRPPLNHPDVHKLQQPDWPGDGEREGGGDLLVVVEKSDSSSGRNTETGLRPAILSLCSREEVKNVVQWNPSNPGPVIVS